MTPLYIKALTLGQHLTLNMKQEGYGNRDRFGQGVFH